MYFMFVNQVNIGLVVLSCSILFPFFILTVFVPQSLVEDAKGRKFSSLASKPEPEKQSSINSMENGFNGKDKQNLMVC